MQSGGGRGSRGRGRGNDEEEAQKREGVIGKCQLSIMESAQLELNAKRGGRRGPNHELNRSMYDQAELPIKDRANETSASEQSR